MDLDTSLPTEILHRQTPGNSGFTSFMAGRESAQKERQLRMQEEQNQMRQVELGLKQKAMAQDFQMNALKIANEMDARDERVSAGARLTSFASVIRRAKMAGSSDPQSIGFVTDFLSSNPGTLAIPEGRALWDEFKATSASEARSLQEVREIRERAFGQVAVAQERAAIEESRIEGRMDLEQFKARKREDLARLSSQLRLDFQGGKAVTREEWINRHLNAMAGESPSTHESSEEKKARFGNSAIALGEIFDGIQQAPAAPVLSPSPAESIVAPPTTRRRYVPGQGLVPVE